MKEARKTAASPKAPLAVRPVSVSQNNCDLLLGFSRRQYLTACQVHRAALRPVHIGRTVVTTIANWEALIETLGGGDQPFDEPAKDDVVEAQPRTAAEVLDLLGLQMAES